MMHSSIQFATLKRIFAVFALLALVFGPVSSAFAQDTDNENNNESQPGVCDAGFVGVPPNCVPYVPPSVDVCNNIDGTQEVVPEGYTVNEDGTCTQIIEAPVDVCNNIDGTQEVVPEGYVEDDGACNPKNNETEVQECIGNNLLTNGSFEDPIPEAHGGQWEIFPSVTGWTSSSEDGIELWNGLYGAASDGNQNAELDGNIPTTISQSVATVPGDTYQVTFDFAARPQTGTADNNVQVSFGGNILGTVSADGTTDETKVWKKHNFSYTANSASSELALADLGTSNGLGSLVDNVSVCLVKEKKDDDHHHHEHHISGYKFNDENANGIWDEGESALSNWTIHLEKNNSDEESDNSDDTILSTTTDANGYYSFDVDSGSYSVTEVQQEGWQQTATIGDTADGNACNFKFGEEEQDKKFSDSQWSNTNTCNFGNHRVVENQCTLTGNLLANGSFENPVLDPEGPKWGIFDSVINGLQWAVKWVNPSEGAPEVAKLELQSGHPASDGNQYAELDSNYTNPNEPVIIGDARVKITQTVPTIVGAKYTLTYDFSALPGHGKAINNKVQVLINGSVVDTQTASLPHGATTTSWTHQSYTFTATGTSTEVGLADAGKSNTFGTLIDNVSLVGCELPETPKACSLNVVSDTTNTVTEKDGANAVLTWVHPSWLAAITDSTAKWIWGSATVENPTQDETETFVKKFTWNGPATTALLKVAADNSYSVKLNGTEVGADASENNYAATDDIDVQSAIVTGENTLEIAVKNWGIEGGTSESNPAGVLYDLNVVGNTEVDCTKVPDVVPTPEKDTYEIFGYVWNDTNKNEDKDADEPDLSGRTVRGENTETHEIVSTESDGTGHYSLHVTAGTWKISEYQETGWEQTTHGDGDGTYTVTVPNAPIVMAFPLNILFNVAEAATLGSVGPKNFGNVYTQSSHGGRSSSSNGGSSNTPQGQVLGASTSTAPTGKVLGAATTTMPVGAPNTGAGGTSPVVINLPSLSAILTTGVSRRKSK